jgi:tyrosinase
MASSTQRLVNAFFVPGRSAALESIAPGEAEAAPAPAASRPFSIFVNEDLSEAIALADRMAEAANAAPAAESGGDQPAVEAALAVAAGARRGQPAGLVDHAVKLFLTHHRSARNLRIPNLMSRMRVAPSQADGAGLEGLELAELGGTTGTDEDRLGWFREDPLANEHHEHWHLVYVRFDGDNFKVRPRHGELFYYMHEQMLARYDAERLAAGLPPVAPFEDYDRDVGAGYDPGGLQIGESVFAKRDSSLTWQPLPRRARPPYTPAMHAQRRDRLLQAATTRRLEVPNGPSVALEGEKGSDILGHTAESGGKSLSGSDADSHFGNHHGFGHVLTAILSADGVGVMADPAAAIRDPYFWRWHRHVDEINFAYQQQLEPHDFAAAPQVGFGGGEDAGIALFATGELRAAGIALGASPEAICEAVLGGDRFGEDASRGTLRLGQVNGRPVEISLHDTIDTELRRGVFQLNTPAAADEEPRFAYPYLWHPSYHFGVRLRSTAASAQQVTLRLFLCPAFDIDGRADASLDDRRLWIELDKFEASLEAGADTVLVRADTSSTVVRRPVTPLIADPQFVRDLHFGEADQGEDHPNAAACECGWPYHLLYPRGTSEGMRFALLAMVTKDDRLARQGQCGSMSFCAVNEEYPDAKPMGYPFDRPLAGPMGQLVADNPSLSMRFITIRTR